MGQKYIIKQTKNGLIQIPIEKYMEITPEEVIKIGNSIGIDWNTIDKNELVEGAIQEAKEHPKVVTDTAKAVQVALDHLQEIPNYYSKLKEMEGEVVQKGGPGSGRYPKGNGQLESEARINLELHSKIQEAKSQLERPNEWRLKSIERFGTSNRPDRFTFHHKVTGEKREIELESKKPYDPDSPEHERDIKENE